MITTSNVLLGKQIPNNYDKPLLDIMFTGYGMHDSTKTFTLSGVSPGGQAHVFVFISELIASSGIY